jgi:hypothetical protein
MPDKGLEEFETSTVEERRAFLKNCAKFAATMPPAITLLVSASGAWGQETPPGVGCSHICQDSSGQPPLCDCLVQDDGALDPLLFQQPLNTIDEELIDEGQTTGN